MFISQLIRTGAFGLVVAGFLATSWADSGDERNQDRFLFDKNVLIDKDVQAPSVRPKFDSDDFRRETLQLRKPELFAADSVTAKFVGHWKLVSYEIRRDDGTTTEWPMVGRLYYDAGGNMAAQLMPLSDEPETPNRRYFAYFGTYEIDVVKGTVTHHVEASVTASWVGTDLVRAYSFDGDQLRLSLPNGSGDTTNTLTWIRADARDGATGERVRPFVYDVGVEE